MYFIRIVAFQITNETFLEKLDEMKDYLAIFHDEFDTIVSQVTKLEKKFVFQLNFVYFGTLR